MHGSLFACIEISSAQHEPASEIELVPRRFAGSPLNPSVFSYPFYSTKKGTHGHLNPLGFPSLYPYVRLPQPFCRVLGVFFQQRTGFAGYQASSILQAMLQVILSIRHVYPWSSLRSGPLRSSCRRSEPPAPSDNPYPAWSRPIVAAAD